METQRLSSHLLDTSVTRMHVQIDELLRALAICDRPMADFEEAVQVFRKALLKFEDGEARNRAIP